MHRLPQIGPPLNIQPELWTIPKHPSQNQRRRSRHRATVVTQFINVLALNPHSFRQPALRQPQRLHKLFRQNLSDTDRLAFRSQHPLTSQIPMVVQVHLSRFTTAPIPPENHSPLSFLLTQIKSNPSNVRAAFRSDYSAEHEGPDPCSHRPPSGAYETSGSPIQTGFSLSVGPRQRNRATSHREN